MKPCTWVPDHPSDAKKESYGFAAALLPSSPFAISDIEESPCLHRPLVLITALVSDVYLPPSTHMSVQKSAKLHRATRTAPMRKVEEIPGI